MVGTIIYLVGAILALGIAIYENWKLDKSVFHFDDVILVIFSWVSVAVWTYFVLIKKRGVHFDDGGEERKQNQVFQ